ncbi:LuxR C-terminal-related transcriptional regulator [Streptomyces kebangsaanensis]|uniref:LuxR C-terminal-related transcriptional regulator n=1 Tax=Streptomyces kebangsaanensis TaxID=864058 RepID=A0ABW6KSH6_9ACTN
MDMREKSLELTAPQLSGPADRLYRLIAKSPECTAETAAQQLNMSMSELERAIQDLRRLGLLSADQSGTGTLVPFPVEFARIKVLNPLQQDLNRIQSLVDRLRCDLNELDVHTPHPGHSHYSLKIVHELDDVRRLIAGLAAECREEALTSQPGGARKEEVLAEAMDRTTKMLSHGVKMRTLYQHTARFSPVTVSYVSQVTPLGAQIRTLADGFPRCIVFDRETAVLPLLEDSKGAAVVRDPHVILFIVEAFERAWNASSEFSPENHVANRRTVTSEVQRTIISLLVQGESDKRIAHVVGISLRNCQRHISNIMKSIGARNRLHAGYLLSKEPFSLDPLRNT